MHTATRGRRVGVALLQADQERSDHAARSAHDRRRRPFAFRRRHRRAPAWLSTAAEHVRPRPTTPDRVAPDGRTRPSKSPTAAPAAPASALSRRWTSPVTTRDVMRNGRSSKGAARRACSWIRRRKSRRRSSRSVRPRKAPRTRWPPQRPGALRSCHGSEESGALVAGQLVQTLGQFGVDANGIGQISGPRGSRSELQLTPARRCRRSPASRTTSQFTRRRQPRIRPDADPRRVGGERRAAELLAHLVRLGDVDDDMPQSGEPARGLTREGHFRRAVLDQPQPRCRTS